MKLYIGLILALSLLAVSECGKKKEGKNTKTPPVEEKTKPESEEKPESNDSDEKEKNDSDTNKGDDDDDANSGKKNKGKSAPIKGGKSAKESETGNKKADKKESTTPDRKSKNTSTSPTKGTAKRRGKPKSSATEEDEDSIKLPSADAVNGIVDLLKNIAHFNPSQISDMTKILDRIVKKKPKSDIGKIFQPLLNILKNADSLGIYQALPKDISFPIKEPQVIGNVVLEPFSSFINTILNISLKGTGGAVKGAGGLLDGLFNGVKDFLDALTLSDNEAFAMIPGMGVFVDSTTKVGKVFRSAIVDNAHQATGGLLEQIGGNLLKIGSTPPTPLRRSLSRTAHPSRK